MARFNLRDLREHFREPKLIFPPLLTTRSHCDQQDLLASWSPSAIGAPLWRYVTSVAFVHRLVCNITASDPFVTAHLARTRIAFTFGWTPSIPGRPPRWEPRLGPPPRLLRCLHFRRAAGHQLLSVPHSVATLSCLIFLLKTTWLLERKLFFWGNTRLASWASCISLKLSPAFPWLGQAAPAR